MQDTGLGKKYFIKTIATWQNHIQLNYGPLGISYFYLNYCINIAKPQT